MSLKKPVKKKILFLCTHNSARSQMAEGLLKFMNGERYEACSAGIVATCVDPRAIKVMSEIGIDISGQASKDMDKYRGTLFDMAVTVCDKAKEMCPVCVVSLETPAETPKALETIHKTFRDPAEAEGSDEEQLDAFRQVRDEIKEWIARTFVDRTTP